MEYVAMVWNQEENREVTTREIFERFGDKIEQKRLKDQHHEILLAQVVELMQEELGFDPWSWSSPSPFVIYGDPCEYGWDDKGFRRLYRTETVRVRID